MQDKVVLHSIFFHSLVQLGFEEQLLDRDNYYYRRDFSQNKPVSKWIENQIKQQLILTPTLITNDLNKYEGSLKGDLLQKLHEAEHSVVHMPGSFLSNIDYNVVSQILELKGMKSMDEDGFKKTLIELSTVYQDIERSRKENDYPELIFDNVEAENIFRGALGQSELIFSDDFKSKIWRSKELRGSVEHIWSCYDDVYNLIQISNKENALLMIPLKENFQSRNIDSINQNEDLCFLFEVTCKELGTIPVPYNLENAFKLSDGQEAMDLRVFLNHWVDCLIDVNDLEIERLKKEISSALKFLGKKERYGKQSALMTYIGVPATAIGFINILMTIPGIAITLYGTYATFQGYRIKRKYNWAMFKGRVY
jgi:hypothetical protein